MIMLVEKINNRLAARRRKMIPETSHWSQTSWVAFVTALSLHPPIHSPFFELLVVTNEIHARMDRIVQSRLAASSTSVPAIRLVYSKAPLASFPPTSDIATVAWSGNRFHAPLPRQTSRARPTRLPHNTKWTEKKKILTNDVTDYFYKSHSTASISRLFHAVQSLAHLIHAHFVGLFSFFFLGCGQDGQKITNHGKRFQNHSGSFEKKFLANNRPQNNQTFLTRKRRKRRRRRDK